MTPSAPAGVAVRGSPERWAGERWAGERWAVERWAVRLSLPTFAGLIVASAAVYPGGSWVHPEGSGFDLVHNFLCDLLPLRAIGGRANLAAALLARSAMVLVLIFGVGTFWAVVPRLFSPGATRLRRAVPWFGWTATVGLIGVPFTPSLAASALHGWIVVAAGGAALATGVVSLGGLAGGGFVPRWLVGLGFVALVVAGVDLALYLDHFLRQTPVGAALPAGQKAAVVLVLAFVWLVVERATDRRPTTPRGRP